MLASVLVSVAATHTGKGAFNPVWLLRMLLPDTQPTSWLFSVGVLIGSGPKTALLPAKWLNRLTSDSPLHKTGNSARSCHIIVS